MFILFYYHKQWLFPYCYQLHLTTAVPPATAYFSEILTLRQLMSLQTEKTWKTIRIRCSVWSQNPQCFYSVLRPFFYRWKFCNWISCWPWHSVGNSVLLHPHERQTDWWKQRRMPVVPIDSSLRDCNQEKATLPCRFLTYILTSC